MNEQSEAVVRAIVRWISPACLAPWTESSPMSHGPGVVY